MTKHDVFGFPERITDDLDRAIIEGAVDSIITQGTSWWEYVTWRNTILTDHERGLHLCGEDNCVWCPLGEDCDEHRIATLRKACQ